LGAKTDAPNHAGKKPTDYAVLDPKLAALFGVQAVAGARFEEDEEDEKEPMGASADRSLMLPANLPPAGSPEGDARVSKVIGSEWRLFSPFLVESL
jgi:hypothetical protein